MPDEGPSTMVDAREDNTAPTARLSHGQWLSLMAASLLVLASYWSSATACLRIVLVWAVGLVVLGRWGQRRLSESHRAFLAALIGVSIVHLAIFPTSGQPPAALIAKAIILAAAVLRLPGQTFGGAGAARPFGAWNRYVAGGLALSAAVGILLSFRVAAVNDALAAIPAILAPVGYVLLFGALHGCYREADQRPFLVRLLRAVPVAVAALALTQFGFLEITKKCAGQSLQRDNPSSALVWNTAATTINGRLRFRGVEDRLLLQRAHILDALDRPADALGVLLKRYRLQFPRPDDAMLQSLSGQYLSTAPLETQIVALSHPAFLWRFDRLPLPDDRAERSRLLGLFARCGRLDRLQVEYAQRGLREGLDFEYLLRCLRPPQFVGDESSRVWAEYFAGICQARLGQRDAARDSFRRVLSRWPNYHNARAWLERLGATSESPKDAALTSAPLNRVENAQMLGNHRWGLNVDDALWTALEATPGRYTLQFEVNGLPAESEWPVLMVYLDGAVVLEQPVRTQAWTTVTREAEFTLDACHRLVVGFPNDILKAVGGRTINRNLYLRRIQIAKIGRDKADRRR